jgi:hypothetical protein
VLIEGGNMPLKKKKRKAAVKRKTVKRKAVKRKIVKKKIVKRMTAKVAKRKPAKKKTVLKKVAAKTKKSKENIIGSVTHYFPQVRAAVVKLKAPLSVGDTIKVKGHTTDFKQKIASMQIDHVPISQAKKGDEIGLLVESRVRRHDVVYKA